MKFNKERFIVKSNRFIERTACVLTLLLIFLALITANIGVFKLLMMLLGGM